MTDDPDTRRNRLDRLVSLSELARYAEPEDRVRLERTIELISRARIRRLSKPIRRRT
jgi:hypothetical protein